MITIYPQSRISEYITDYYVNSSDYKGSKLFFYDDISSYNYCIIKKNTNDSLWYVITNGKLKGYLQDGLYNYQFDFEKYISFDNNKPFQTNSSAIDFRIQGDCSSQMYIMFSTGNIIQDNIYINKFTLLDDGRVLVNDKSDIENFECDYYLKVNFWNRENGNIYNYPIQNTVEKNSYFPITIYGDYDAYVILKDGDGNIIKRMDLGNGNQYDYATEFIWIPENCESIDIYEYNSNGYNEILNGVQPNLLNNSKVVSFQHNDNPNYMTETYMSDEVEPYNRFQPIVGQVFSAFGGTYTYDDVKALYVVSFDVRVESYESVAKVATYTHNDFWDSLNRIYDVEPFKWTRCSTKPFNIGGAGDAYLIVANDSDDRLYKWVDIKNVKIEKVKFDKYVNFIPKYAVSNLYSFANDRFYLEGGKTYTLRVIGSNTNATLGRHTLVEISDYDNFYAYISTNEYPTAFQKSITFTAPATKSYQINSYYYPQIADESGTVYVQDYYLYEGVTDPGEDIAPTDYIPATLDMEGQTNYKSFTKSTVCPGPVSNDYFYLDNNSVMDRLSCKANSFNLESVEKEYVKLGNKNYNNRTTVKKQIVQNTGYQLDEKQVYSLMKSPLVYKIEPKDFLINKNYIFYTQTSHIISTPGWVIFPLKTKLIPGKRYFFQVDLIQTTNPTNLEDWMLGVTTNYSGDVFNLTPNTSFVAPDNVSIYNYFNVVNNYAYTPLVFKNVMITEGDSPKVFEPEVLPFFDIKNYSIENTSFDGYQHKQLSERNFELTFTEQEQIVKRNNIKQTFFE